MSARILLAPILALTACVPPHDAVGTERPEPVPAEITDDDSNDAQFLMEVAPLESLGTTSSADAIEAAKTTCEALDTDWTVENAVASLTSSGMDLGETPWFVAAAIDAYCPQHHQAFLDFLEDLSP